MMAHVKELTAQLPDLATKVRAGCRAFGLLHPFLDQLVDRITDNAIHIARRR
jgi:hypothetical protein